MGAACAATHPWYKVSMRLFLSSLTSSSLHHQLASLHNAPRPQGGTATKPQHMPETSLQYFTVHYLMPLMA